MTGQRRPVGTFRTATVEWKLKVRARMEELGMSRADFSRALKAMTGTGTAQTLRNLLGREDEVPTKSSSTKLMAPIHKILGWPAPTDDEGQQKSYGDLRDRFLKAFPDLDDTDRSVVDLIVAKYTKNS
jgi:hypothetical protein